MSRQMSNSCDANIIDCFEFCMCANLCKDTNARLSKKMREK